jgi:hypothetical protein|nr:MAG TPA: hypothetical protein [Caudoviricetes sp.]
MNAKTKRLTDLTVTVTYTVGLDVDVPEKVAEQLEEIYNNGIALTDEYYILYERYEEAFEWLNNNIRERDCCDWKYTIDNLEIK